ncbi:GRP family sugar transporter [Lactiplantibacillus modestisalitolerans]|uniref:GRP family sugar transporter n=1 Tax=Lactiplantibacillus modestisalitolerans TaxID=1457219 RepID=A0ABV5WV76_9LACO|nr:GRP family sugar transporter [Lactiplantibacillus modestisalitolerans]
MWAITIGLIPALCWGVLPIWIRKFAGGTFRQQLIGTTVGITIVAAGLTWGLHLHCQWSAALLFFASGFCWSFGQGGQYYGYEKLGVSTTMPLSTAMQIVGNSIIGGLLFHEWSGLPDILLSLVMLLIILFGVALTNQRLHLQAGQARYYLILAVSTIGYWGYSALPHYAQVGSNLNGFLPQALGMLSAALLIGATKTREVWRPATGKNVSSGIIFSAAAATYLVSLSLNGMVNAFILSQLNVIVSTLIGGFVLNEFIHGQARRSVFGLVILLTGATGLVML